MLLSQTIFKRSVLFSISICACTISFSQKDKPGKPTLADLKSKSTAVKKAGQMTDTAYWNNYKGAKVSGVVTDAATKKPLAAIRVSESENNSVFTDDDGNFLIKVPDYQATLTIEGEGFQSKEVALKGRNTVTAGLYEDKFNSIYDVAYFPLGEKPLHKTVYPAGSVNPDGAWARSTENPDGLLQGKVAGLNATMRSGTPGAGAYLNMRGFNSLYAGNQPLIVVDGMIYDVNDYGNSLIAGHYTNAFTNLDNKDIKNITVLKDGSSLYGTRGANGVILITTNHAELLATRIDFGAYYGSNFAPRKMSVMKSGDYRTYLSDLLKTSGMTPEQVKQQPYFNDSPANPDYFRYHNETDWQDEVLDNTAANNYYIKVSGGDNIAKYALSMGYLKNAGITKATDFTRYSTRFNSDLNLSKKLSASSNLSFTYYEQNLRDQGLSPETNPIFLSLIKAPFLNKNEVADNGSVSPNLADTDIFGTGNPAAVISGVKAFSQVYRFFGSVNLKYEFTPSLSLTVLGGIAFDKVREQIFIPRKGISNDTLATAIGDSRLGSQVKRIFYLYNDTYLNYIKKFGSKSNINARVGLRYMDNETEQDVGTSFNSATDDFISVGTGVTNLRRVGGDLGKNRWMNIYAGADYGFANKLFITAGVAVDGSSRFGSNIEKALKINGNNFAVMPSVGAAWLVSSEKFMSKIGFVELFKLRASYSKTGNDDIGNYTSKQSYVSQNLLGIQGLVRNNIANPALQWESNTKLNAGFDLALFNERLNFGFDVFRNKTSNMIIYENVPVASGYTFAITNTGAMKTSGTELTAGARIINTKQLKWDLGVTLATYKNRITQLPQSASILTSYGGATILTEIGSPSNVFYGLKANGVFTTDAEAAQANLVRKMTNGTIIPFMGGDIRYTDFNGDGIIDDKDRQKIGNPNPDYTGMISNKIGWKRLTIDALFTFSKGNKVYNATRRTLESVSSTNNQLVNVNNRWRVNGQVTDVPKAAFGDPLGNNDFSDRWIEDGSFLRLKNVSISYDLPLKAGFVKNVTIYIVGNNLVTFSKYLGYDPEFYAGENVFARGIDVGLEPQFRSFVAGFRMGL